MSQWSAQPPPRESAVPYRLLRVPADKAIRGIITCTDVVGRDTHFVGNRTVPCGLPGPCKPHDDGFSWRWHAYVSLVITATFEHVILELTANGSESVRNYSKVNGDVRYCEITAFRPNKRHNGRVIVNCKAADPMRTTLPDPPNIQKILCHIWAVRYEEPRNNFRSREGALDVQLADALNVPKN